MTQLKMLSADDKLAEIRRLYFNASKSSIQQDLAKALDLLKSMDTEDERERATVYMEGLAEMQKDWLKQVARPKGAGGAKRSGGAGRPATPGGSGRAGGSGESGGSGRSGKPGGSAKTGGAPAAARKPQPKGPGSPAAPARPRKVR